MSFFSVCVIVVVYLYITQEAAIVNSCGTMLNMNAAGAAAKAISNAAGTSLQKECNKIVKREGQVKTGHFKVTRGHNLEARNVYHAVIPTYSMLSMHESEKVSTLTWVNVSMATGYVLVKKSYSTVRHRRTGGGGQGSSLAGSYFSRTQQFRSYSMVQSYMYIYVLEAYTVCRGPYMHDCISTLLLHGDAYAHLPAHMF